jgi:hypothetical protein
MSTTRREEIRQEYRVALQPHAEEISDVVSKLGHISGQLDISFVTCGECGRKRFNNYAQKKLAERLDQMRSQLESFAFGPVEPELDDCNN